MSNITSEELSAAAGILLSLGFSYIPGVHARFGTLDPTRKRLIMLGLLLACAVGVFGLGCLHSGYLPSVPCDREGAWGLLKVFASALIANQAAFTVSPRFDRPAPSGKPRRRTANPLLTGRMPVITSPQEAMDPSGEKLLVKRPPAPSRASAPTTASSASTRPDKPASLAGTGDAGGGDPLHDNKGGPK